MNINNNDSFKQLIKILDEKNSKIDHLEKKIKDVVAWYNRNCYDHVHINECHQFMRLFGQDKENVGKVILSEEKTDPSPPVTLEYVPLFTEDERKVLMELVDSEASFDDAKRDAILDSAYDKLESMGMETPKPGKEEEKG